MIRVGTDILIAHLHGAGDVQRLVLQQVLELEETSEDLGQLLGRWAVRPGSASDPQLSGGGRVVVDLGGGSGQAATDRILEVDPADHRVRRRGVEQSEVHLCRCEAKERLTLLGECDPVGTKVAGEAPMACQEVAELPSPGLPGPLRAAPVVR